VYLPQALQALIFAHGKLAASWARNRERDGAVHADDIPLLNLVLHSIRTVCRPDAGVDCHRCHNDVSRRHVKRTGSDHEGEFAETVARQMDLRSTYSTTRHDHGTASPTSIAIEDDGPHVARMLHLRLYKNTRTTLCKVMFRFVDAEMTLGMHRHWSSHSN
jgi:hypothetical protein